jgi:hypothetical protein
MGEMQVSLYDWEYSSMRDIHYMIRGYYRRVEREQRDQLNNTRILASVLLTPHMPKGKRLTPQDIIKFPDEVQQQTEQSEITSQEHELFSKFDEIIKAKHGNDR